MEQTHHTIAYVELAADDLGASRSFYESAFGWSFNDYGPAYAGIRSADGQGEVGGLNATGQATSGSPLVLLVSEDVEASLAAVEAAGTATEGHERRTLPIRGRSEPIEVLVLHAAAATAPDRG